MLHFVERALHISEHTNTGITVSQHYVLTPETRLLYFSFNTILGHLDLLTFADPVMDITLALGPTVFTVWAPGMHHGPGHNGGGHGVGAPHYARLKALGQNHRDSALDSNC